MYGSEELYNYLGMQNPAMYRAQDDQQYLDEINRASDIGTQGLANAGNLAAHYALMNGQTIGDALKSLPGEVQSSMDTAQRFSANKQNANQSGARFAEEQSMAPQRMARANAEVATAQAQAQQAQAAARAAQAEENFEESPIDGTGPAGFNPNTNMSPVPAGPQLTSTQPSGPMAAAPQGAPGQPHMSFREAMMRQKMQNELQASADTHASTQSSIAANKSNIQTQQASLADLQSQKRVAAASSDIMRNMQQNMVQNPEYVAQQAAKKYGLNPQETTVALADAQGKIKQSAQISQQLQQNTLGYQAHAQVLASATKQLEGVKNLVNDLKTYTQGEVNPLSGTLVSTHASDDARVQFANMVEAQGKPQLAEAIRSKGVSNEFVDTQMKVETLRQLSDLEANVRSSAVSLGAQYGNSPEIQNLLRTIGALKMQVTGTQTGVGKFLPSSPADNSVNGAYVPVSAPQTSAGKQFMQGPVNAPQAPQGNPNGTGFMPNFQQRPSMKQFKVPTPTNAQNVGVGPNG